MPPFQTLLAVTLAVLGTVTAVLAGAGRPAQAQSQPVCVPPAVLAAKLDTQYGEAITAEGVDGNGNLLQVFTSPQTGSWTIAVTLPGGPSCVVSSGEGWSDEKATIAGAPKIVPEPDRPS